MKEQRFLIPLVGVIALVAVGFVLKVAQAVILPLIIAWLLSYLLAPIVNFLVCRRIPLAVAIFCVVLLLIGFCYLIGFFVYGRVMSFVGQYDVYAAKLLQISTDFMTRLHIPPEYIKEFHWTGEIGRWLVSKSGSFVGFMGDMTKVLIFLIFMLTGKPYAKVKIEAALGEKSQKISEVTECIAGEISRYLSIKLFISTITALLALALLTIMDIDFAVTWAVLTFLLNFIPTIGSIVATIPPVLIALVQFYPSFWPAVILLIGLIVIQQVMGNILDPKLTGDRLNLSPVVILLSLLFWGWLWGITGALLSVPITSAIKIACENIELLKPVSVMMGSGKIAHRKKQEEEREKEQAAHEPA